MMVGGGGCSSQQAQQGRTRRAMGMKGEKQFLIVSAGILPAEK